MRSSLREEIGPFTLSGWKREVLPEGGTRIAQGEVCREADETLGSGAPGHVASRRAARISSYVKNSARQRHRVEFADAAVRSDDEGEREGVPVAVGVRRFVQRGVGM